jgi:hypothetical protein
MGLDLHCDNYSVRVGAYSRVSEIYREWILASIEYLKEWIKLHPIKPYDSDDSTDSDNPYGEDPTFEYKITQCEKSIQMLNSWLIDLNSFNLINYDRILYADLDLLRKFDLIGLHIFVNHSDCQGYITSNESRDILKSLTKICPYLHNTGYNFNTDIQNAESYYLFEIFNKSANSGKKIKFM